MNSQVEGDFQIRHPARYLFDHTYGYRCRAFDKLKKYATARRKKRWLVFTATQYIMLKYKQIALKHWQLLYKHQLAKKHKMGSLLHYMYLSRLALTLGKLEQVYGRKVPAKKVHQARKAQEFHLLLNE